MKHNRTLTALLTTVICSVVITSCSKNDQDTIDTSYPTIDMHTDEAFPRQCSEFIRGTKKTIIIFVADNKELGSVSIDIHHNFDHHSHSTEVDDCGMDNKKTPQTPLLLIKAIPIPDGNKTYTVTDEIEIPAHVDPGDYHFMIRVTDKEGWQTIKGLSIKVK